MGNSLGQMKKTYILLFFIFITGFLWRIYFLDAIPTALHPDELAYSINAQSWLLSGTSLDGKWSPTKFNTLTPMLAEWPTIITSFGYLFSHNPLIATRLPSVLMGSALPFIFAWIVWGLFKKKDLSWGVLIVASLNPWLLQNSRFGFDPLYSIFFYSLAMGFLLNFPDWKKYFSLPLFAIGFLQYQGYKLLLVPIVGILLLKNWQAHQFSLKKLINRQTLIVGVFALVVFFAYLFKLKSEGAASRVSNNSLVGETYLTQIAARVNSERRLSAQNQMTPAFSNKFYSLGLERIDEVFDAFSAKHLFLSGDPGPSGFSVWSHGFFYLVDGILIFVGLIYLFREKNFHRGWPILAFFMIGLIPLLLNTANRWYIFRPSFSYLSLIFITGLGLAQLWQHKNLLTKTIVALSLVISISNFSFHYFVRFPVYSATGNYFDHRQLASYVSRASHTKPVVIYSPEAESLYQSYLLYAQKINSKSLPDIQQNYRQGQYLVENVSFLHRCVPADQLDLVNNTILVDPYEEACRVSPESEVRVAWPAQTPHLALASMIDSGETYFVYGDAVCVADQLQAFISAKTLSQLSLEKLSNTDYCQQWVTNVEKINN